MRGFCPLPYAPRKYITLSVFILPNPFLFKYLSGGSLLCFILYFPVVCKACLKKTYSILLRYLLHQTPTPPVVARYALGGLLHAWVVIEPLGNLLHLFYYSFSHTLHITYCRTTIVHVIFFSLHHNQPEKQVFSLKHIVYPYVTNHWRALGLSEKSMLFLSVSFSFTPAVITLF